MTLPADLVLTEANVTFPTSIALDGTETFTLTIDNTPQAGGADVNEDFYIIVQLTPDSDINQNYIFEFLYPASLEGSGIPAASSVGPLKFDISFEYSYISKPLIGHPVAPTIGTYEAIISVNLDAMGRRYVSESDFYNNSVRITSIEVTPSLGNRPAPGFEGCRIPLGQPTFPPPPPPLCVQPTFWWSTQGGGGGGEFEENYDYDTNWGWDTGEITNQSGAGCFTHNQDEWEWHSSPGGVGGRGRWDPFDEGWALYTPPVADNGWVPPTPMHPLPEHPDENGDPIPSGDRGGGDNHGTGRQSGVVHLMCDDFMWFGCPRYPLIPAEEEFDTSGVYPRTTGPVTFPDSGFQNKICWEKLCPGSPGATGGTSYYKRKCTKLNGMSPGTGYIPRIIEPSADGKHPANCVTECMDQSCPTPNTNNSPPSPADTSLLCWTKPCEDNETYSIQQCLRAPAQPPGRGWNSPFKVEDCDECPTMICPRPEIEDDLKSPVSPPGEHKVYCFRRPCVNGIEQLEQICHRNHAPPLGEGWMMEVMDSCDDCPPIGCPPSVPPPGRGPITYGGGGGSIGATGGLTSSANATLKKCTWWGYAKDTGRCEEVPFDSFDCNSPIAGYYKSQSECVDANTDGTHNAHIDFMNVGNTSNQSKGKETVFSNVIKAHYRCIPTDKGPLCLAIPDYEQNKDSKDTYSTYNQCTAKCGVQPEENTEVLNSLPSNTQPPINFVIPRHLN